MKLQCKNGRIYLFSIVALIFILPVYFYSALASRGEHSRLYIRIYVHSSRTYTHFHSSSVRQRQRAP